MTRSDGTEDRGTKSADILDMEFVLGLHTTPASLHASARFLPWAISVLADPVSQ
jgi:hypothetical protein